MVFVFEIRGGFHTYMGRCASAQERPLLHPAPSRAPGPTDPCCAPPKG